MNTKPVQPIIVAPELDKESRDLILLLRTLKSGIVEAAVVSAKPTFVTIRYPDMLNRQPMFTGPLSVDEQNVLATVKFLRYGRLVVNVSEVGKYQILGDSEQKFRCGEINWNDWIA